MPTLTRWFVKASLVSLVYMLLGFTFGALMLTNKGIPFAPMVWALLPVHIEFLSLGWLTQLALGVAFWILPRMGSSSPRGNESWSWAAFILVNLGIVLVCLALYLGLGWFGLLTRNMQMAGFLAFVIGNWQRIYPLGKIFQNHI